VFETAGASTILEPAPSLIAALALPLVGALAARGRHAARVAIATSGGLVALSVALAFRLALLAPTHALGARGPQLARIGQLDLAADLVLDRPSAALLVLGAALSLAAVLHATWTGALSRLPRLGLVALGVSLVTVADALPLVAAGFALTTFAAWGLSRGEAHGAVGALVASDAALVIGLVTLFWAPGGTFGPAGYAPDAQPRFALVTATNAVAPEQKCTLSLATYAGSLVVADDGPPLPGEPLRAPFTATLDPGDYSFRIHAGVASQDALVSHVTLAAGRAYVLAPFGPTVSVRSLGDQSRIPRPALALAGDRSLRVVLGTPTRVGLREATLLGLLLFGGALLRLARIITGRALELEVLPVVVLAFRLAPAVDSGAAFALGVAIVSVLLAGRACAEDEPHAALSSVLAANVALSVAVLLAGEPGAALVIAIASLLAASAWRIGDDGSGDARWLGVACAAASGVIPAAGTSSGLAAALGSALVAHETALGLALLASTCLVALASFRVYDAIIGRQRPRGDGSAPVRSLAAVLAVLAIVTGAALGAGTSAFGGHVVPLVRRVVSGGAVVGAAPRLAAGALAATVAAAIAGAAMVRRKARLPALGAPALAVGLAAGLAGRGVHFLSRSVRALDREVVEDLTVALGSALMRVGVAVRRLEARATLAPLDRATEALLDRATFDGQRLRHRILVGMVALLAIIVLSSLVLGR
jgi:hypothetical protein